MQHPRLNVGLIGFSAEQRAQAGLLLATNNAEATQTDTGSHKLASTASAPTARHPVWEISDFREANALLLHAPYTEDGALHFDSPLNATSPVAVHLSELALPFAVQWTAWPATNLQNTSTVRTVHIDRPDSLVKTLQYFEALLRPLRTLFAMADQMIERRSELDSKHVYHLMRNNTLDCIVDISRRHIMVRDGIRPVDVYDAAWLSRPLSANSQPQGFSVWTMEEAAWIYALHFPVAKLPARYLQAPIYFRRLPRVRSSMLYPRHTNLLEMLGCAALTYDQLCECQDIDTANLERDLHGLYLCRAITTQSQKVARESENQGDHSGLFSRPATTLGGGSQTYRIDTLPGYLL